MTGATSAHDLDAALQSMASSQHTLKQVEPIQEHGRLHRHHGFWPARASERMLQTNPAIRIQLNGSAIPAYSGAFELFERGISSTLAPSTGQHGDGWRAQFNCNSNPLLLCWSCWWTCGPLLLACSSEAAAHLTRTGPWRDRQRNSRA